MKKYSLIIGILVVAAIVGVTVFSGKTKLFRGSLTSLPSVTSARCSTLGNWMREGTFTANTSSGRYQEWDACQHYYPGAVAGVSRNLCRQYKNWFNEGTFTSNGGNVAQHMLCQQYYPDVMIGRLSGAHCELLKHFYEAGFLTDYLRFHQQPEELAHECSTLYPTIWYRSGGVACNPFPGQSRPDWCYGTTTGSTERNEALCARLRSMLDNGNLTGNAPDSQIQNCVRNFAHIWYSPIKKGKKSSSKFPSPPKLSPPPTFPGGAITNDMQLRLFEKVNSGYDLQFSNNNEVIAAFSFNKSAGTLPSFTGGIVNRAVIEYSDKLRNDVSETRSQGEIIYLQTRDNSGVYGIELKNVVQGQYMDVKIFKRANGFPGGFGGGFGVPGTTGIPAPAPFGGPGAP